MFGFKQTDGEKEAKRVNLNFVKACRNGNLTEAKAILLANQYLYVSANNEEAFRAACNNGHLDIAKWLFQVNRTTDVSANGEEAFRIACFNGRLDIAQWLLQIKPTINISINNEEAFRSACRNGHLEVARWLQTLKPLVYEVTDDGNCRVLTLAEQRQEEKRRYNAEVERNTREVLNSKLPGRVAVDDMTKYTSEFLKIKGGKKGKKRRTKGRRTKGRRTKGRRTTTTKRSKK